MTSAGTAKSEPSVELFFAFPDGVYDYVCAECTALCCKGHGFAGSLEREMRPLLARYPQLETMTIARDGDVMAFATTGSGCVVLDTDNLCRIEKEVGRDSKPNVCKLFPFNLFTRVGKTVVVMPHFLCPLRLVLPARPGSVQGTHAMIAGEISNSRMLDRVYVKNFVLPARVHSSITEDTAIERERTFRNLCSDGIGARRFTDVLMEAAADPVALGTFVERASRIMGYELPKRIAEYDLFDAMLLAFASVYRMGVLDLESEGILRALALAEVMLRRAWANASQEPTLQGVVNTITALRPAQVLLAHADEPFDFGKVTKKTLSFRDSELTFAAFITTRNSENGILSALEQAIPPGTSVADRSVLMIRLGAVMQNARLKRKSKHEGVITKILSSQDNGPGAQVVGHRTHSQERFWENRNA